MERSDKLTIGQVAAQARVSVEAIRYYEQRGLLPKPPRSPSGYRLYDEETVKRLRFIKQARELGFTLQEIREILKLRLDVSSSRENVRRRAERKLAEVEAKLRSLQRIQAALVALSQICERGGPIAGCSFLTIFQRHRQERAIGR